MTIGSVGPALQALPTLNSASAATKGSTGAPSPTGHAPAAALVKETDNDNKENLDVGKHVNVLA